MGLFLYILSGGSAFSSPSETKAKLKDCLLTGCLLETVRPVDIYIVSILMIDKAAAHCVGKALWPSRSSLDAHCF